MVATTFSSTPHGRESSGISWEEGYPASPAEGNKKNA
jgi:hypothetical protein